MLQPLAKDLQVWIPLKLSTLQYKRAHWENIEATMQGRGKKLARTKPALQLSVLPTRSHQLGALRRATALGVRSVQLASPSSLRASRVAQRSSECVDAVS